VLGEHLTATTARGQKQQARFRIIAYNAYRKSFLFLIRDFYGTMMAKYLYSHTGF